MSRAAAPAGPGGGLPRSREQRFLYTVRERESGERAGGSVCGSSLPKEGSRQERNSSAHSPRGRLGVSEPPLVRRHLRRALLHGSRKMTQKIPYGRRNASSWT